MGEIDRFKFYDHMKSYLASPPETLRCDEKHLREHDILNVCAVVMTTNHKVDGIYLPADDRRHYVAWSDAVLADCTGGTSARATAMSRLIWPSSILRPLIRSAAAEDAGLLGDRRRQPRA